MLPVHVGTSRSLPSRFPSRRARQEQEGGREKRSGRCLGRAAGDSWDFGSGWRWRCSRSAWKQRHLRRDLRWRCCYFSPEGFCNLAPKKAISLVFLGVSSWECDMLGWIWTGSILKSFGQECWRCIPAVRESSVISQGEGVVTRYHCTRMNMYIIVMYRLYRYIYA